MLVTGLSELMQTSSAQQILSVLQYPFYLNTILGISKLLGVFAILQKKFRTIKEWAYAGFTIDIVGASLSSFLSGEGMVTALFTLAFVIPVFASYFLWKKVDPLR